MINKRRQKEEKRAGGWMMMLMLVVGGSREAESHPVGSCFSDNFANLL